MRALAEVALVCLVTALCACKETPRSATQSEPQPPPPTEYKISEVRTGDRWTETRLLRGFYPGTEGWRWTARTFAIALDIPPPVSAPTYLELDVTAPHELIHDAGPVNLTIQTSGRILGSHRFKEPGRFTLKYSLPAFDLKPGPITFDFETDRFRKDGERETALIVVAAALKHPENIDLSRDDVIESARSGYLALLKQRETTLPQASQQQFMKLFHEIPVWRHMWFHDVPIAKNPLDLWMMQQIIYELRPDYIVETGTLKGGSALYWAHTLNGAGLENAKVITVDIQDQTATAVKHPLWAKYVTFLKGSSTDPKMVARIAEMVRGRRTLVTLDSDHTGTHVLNELNIYSPMVPPGSYMVVEDTHMDGVPTQPGFGRGPYWAVTEFLKTKAGAAFSQDLTREAFIMTFNPGGWLKRREN
jgi:cephalosporin hydroxylase